MTSERELSSFDFTYSHAKPVNSIYSTIFFLKFFPLLIAGVLKNKLTKFSRNREEVLESFDNGMFKTIFESKSWKKSKSIKDFMFPDGSNEILEASYKKYMILRNKLCKVTLQEYSRYRPIPVLEILKKFTDEEEAIVELGSGWGRNLFYLVALNFRNKLEGYEFTKYGLATAKEINAYFDCKIKFDKIDLTKNFDTVDLKSKTVFTQKVMEQLKYDTYNVIENLINAKPKQVLHIEPVAELYKWTIRDQVSKLYIKAADYQDDLLTILKTFEREGKIKILEVRRFGFAANPYHEDSFIRWIPNFN